MVELLVLMMALGTAPTPAAAATAVPDRRLAEEEARSEPESKADAEGEAAEPAPKKTSPVPLPKMRKIPTPADIEKRDRQRLRASGVRVHATVVKKTTRSHTELKSSSGKKCFKSVQVAFKTRRGTPAIAVVCHPFTDAQWEKIELGKELEVVYLPDGLMKVGNDLVAAEIQPASAIWK